MRFNRSPTALNSHGWVVMNMLKWKNNPFLKAKKHRHRKHPLFLKWAIALGTLKWSKFNRWNYFFFLSPCISSLISNKSLNFFHVAINHLGVLCRAVHALLTAGFLQLMLTCSCCPWRGAVGSECCSLYWSRCFICLELDACSAHLVSSCGRLDPCCVWVTESFLIEGSAG